MSVVRPAASSKVCITRSVTGLLQSLEGMHLHRQVGDATDEIVRQAAHVPHQFDLVETLLDFLPEYPQLHLRQSVAHAAMDSVAEGDMLACVGPIDDQLF